MTQILTPRAQDFAVRKMAELAGIKPFTPEIRTGEKLKVSVRNNRVQITACDLNSLFRGCFLSAEALRTGKNLSLDESRHFASCGVMADMSRGGVWTVESACAFMDRMAALGLNFLMLYTEDLIPVPEYPYFGYLRGRYSREELKRMDDYAAALGIELVPCIQTLGHMGQLLQWKTGNPPADQPAVMLIDDERTYRFIESELKAVRSCFRSGRIHIGMDEAWGVGLGHYYEKHGAVDRFELLNRHLNRVVGMCEKLGLKPMMWSDMFFRLGSETGEYYDKDHKVPLEVVKNIPEVEMVYWDYYNRDEEMIRGMMDGHRAMGKTMVYAGGIWTWSGFLPQKERTLETMRPGLRQALSHRVDTVFATMWGDDGAETPYSLASSLLPLFSEACWEGTVPSGEWMDTLGEWVSGIPAKAFEAFSRFYSGWEDDKGGKALVYLDLLYPLYPGKEPPEACAERLEKGARELEAYGKIPACAYASALMSYAARKGRVIGRIRKLYEAGNREGMKKLLTSEIPALLSELETLRSRHRALWLKEFKRNGWEVLALRYGALAGRTKDVAEALADWADGRLEAVAELEEKPLPVNGRKYAFYEGYVSPTNGF